MATIIQPSIFSWQDVDADSDLRRLKLVLDSLPDEEIVSTMERKRANGGNTYPIRPTWNAVIAGIVFQHPTIESLLRELRRNGELRDACGFDPLFGATAAPSSAAMSHFMANPPGRLGGGRGGGGGSVRGGGRSTSLRKRR